MNRFKRIGRLFVLICTCVLPISAQFNNNFNFGKPEEVQLHRRLPAAFVLPGTEVAVTVSAKAQGSNGLPDVLVPLLETLLRQYDHRIVINKVNPQVTIACVITGYLPPSIQHLTRPGTPASKNVFTGKPTPAQPGQPYTKVTGELAVSYGATDVRNHRTVDAALLETKINAEYDANSNSGAASVGWHLGGNRPSGGGAEAEPVPASVQEVNQRMLGSIASGIAQRLVNTDDRITVWLPKGRLEQAAKLAESGLWERMLEQLSSMSPSNKPQEEAYRLYDLGVAYEAMGYATGDPEQAFKLFEQATIDYGKALDADPTDKHLREPQNRIETAMLITKTLSERARGIEPEVTAGNEESSGSEPPKSTGEKSEVLTNEGIVELKRMGADDENIIGQIRDAQQVNFDLSVAGQRQLFGAGVSNAVIKAMRERSKATAQNPPRTSFPDKTHLPN